MTAQTDATGADVRPALEPELVDCGCGAEPLPSKEEFRRQARVMKALANEARLMIVYRLKDGECHAGALARLVGLDPSTVSKHLSVLRAAGIVADRRDGTTIHYRLLTPCILSVFACAARVIEEGRR